MRRRDRHARAAHADADRRRRPSAGFRLRTPASFDRVVHDALADLAPVVAEAIAGAPIDVAEVPERPAGGNPLVTVETQGAAVRRVTVHRRPAEQRATSRLDLTDVVRDAVEAAVAEATGLDPWGP
jgi:hypothetical protein